ncbi:MAG: hypothetical protein U0R24_01590 [Solirubrobacterales bacterium]
MRERSEIKVNGDDPVAYSYDDDDLITEAGDLEITPDPDSGMTAATSIDEIETASTYSDYGELEAETAEDSASTLYSATYTRDYAGRVETKSETTPAGTNTWEYGYDDAGPTRLRLPTAPIPIPATTLHPAWLV